MSYTIELLGICCDQINVPDLYNCDMLVKQIQEMRRLTPSRFPGLVASLYTVERR